MRRLWAAARFLRCVRANSRARWIEITVKWCVASQVIKRCFCLARSVAPFCWHGYRSYKRLWISAMFLEQFSRHLFVWYTVFSPNQIQPCTPGQTAAAADHCAKKLLLPVATSMKQWCRRCISLQPTYVVPFGWFGVLNYWRVESNHFHQKRTKHKEDFNTIVVIRVSDGIQLTRSSDEQSY